MATAADILRHKGFEVATTTPQATVLEAARQMNLRRIGALVVIEEHGAPQEREPSEAAAPGIGVAARQVAGIFTERDMLTRVVAAERNPRELRVGDVMTTPIVYCAPRTPLDELRALMRHRRIRHVPVIDAGQLCGMISIGDLNAAETETLMQTVTVLEEYITSGR